MARLNVAVNVAVEGELEAPTRQAELPASRIVAFQEGACRALYVAMAQRNARRPPVSLLPLYRWAGQHPHPSSPVGGYAGDKRPHCCQKAGSCGCPRAERADDGEQTRGDPCLWVLFGGWQRFEPRSPVGRCAPASINRFSRVTIFRFERMTPQNRSMSNGRTIERTARAA